jgi:hypothetical protein
LGRWFGQLFPRSDGDFDSRVDLGEVIIRTPGGRAARAVLKGKRFTPRPVLELVGSGPPPL